jgi:uncharacterized membrane protein YbaN (DUF454 family)
MQTKRILYLVIGCVGLGLGAAGAVLPILPSVPFLLVAAWGFGKSSKRLDDWFKRTKLYRNNLESYVRGYGMTRRIKIRIVVTVTALIGTGFILMRGVPIGRIVLAIVWALHLVYFLFIVKTVSMHACDGDSKSTEPAVGRPCSDCVDSCRQNHID